MSSTEKTMSIKKQLASTFLAAERSSSPMRMLTRGAPPTPTSTATEPTMVTTGPHTPTPARATSPISGMLPMYILSTMLYSTLTNCPSMLGMAMRHTRRLTLSLPKLFSAAIILHPFLHIPLRAAQTASYLTLFYREREDVLQESSPGNHLFFIFFR